jgi:hypothetical protein
MATKDHITAEWARKTAETQLGVEAQKQLETCLTRIEEAVKKNQFSLTVYFYASKTCIEELKKRGFKVEAGSEQRDGDWTTITW